MEKEQSPIPFSEQFLAWTFWALYHFLFVILARWVSHNTSPTAGDWSVWRVAVGVAVGAGLAFYGWKRFQARQKHAKDFVNAYTDILNFTFLMMVWFLMLFLLNWPTLPFLILLWIAHTALAPTPFLTRRFLNIEE